MSMHRFPFDFSVVTNLKTSRDIISQCTQSLTPQSRAKRDHQALGRGGYPEPGQQRWPLPLDIPARSFLFQRGGFSLVQAARSCKEPLALRFTCPLQP